MTTQASLHDIHGLKVSGIYLPIASRLFLVLFAAATYLGFLSLPRVAHAESSIPVAYGGVFTAGNEQLYPLYSKNKSKVVKRLGAVLARLSETNALPFNLLTETDSEAVKKETDDPLTLALIITRDDVASEKFVTSVATINKTFVNVGMVAIIYQTGKDGEGKQRNLILYSIPLVGYSMNLEGERDLSPEEIDELLVKNAEIVLEQHLSKRLAKISLSRINGVVASQKEDGYLIDKGAVDGLVDGQNLSILVEGKKVRAKIIRLEKTEAFVKTVEPAADLVLVGKTFSAKNIKGLSADTYQVVSFKISSKKAAALFDEKSLGAQASQWFSDFMVDRAGLVFLPSKAGGQWIDSATENSFMLLMKDGQESIFEVPPPKYPISLELTGIANKMVEQNSVNERWTFGTYLKVDIPAKNHSQEYKNSAAKLVVTGMQSFQQKDVIFDLIYDLTAQVAKEIKFSE
jgi:hypothetical protein